MTKKFKETNEDENRRIVIEASNESQACFKICQTVVPQHAIHFTTEILKEKLQRYVRLKLLKFKKKLEPKIKY